MSNYADAIREKYMNNPPEGMTANYIRDMPEEELLDLDFILDEEDSYGEDYSQSNGFYSF